MVKPSGGPGTPNPTRFTATNYSLYMLAFRAYGIDLWQLDAPKMSDPMKMYDLTATMAEGTTQEQFQLMLQRMLAERFNFKVHWETREMPMYALVIAKNGPKFKESKGDSDKPYDTSRTRLAADGYPELPPGQPGTKTMNGKNRMQLINVPMSRLTTWLAISLRGPVEDTTGLTGKYDMALYWSKADALSAAAPEAPSGPTIVEALKEQLGLAVEKRKGPVKVLVVDHFDWLPTPN